jgi:hypothetical protein
LVQDKKSTIVELAIFWGLSICAVAVSEVVGLTPLWRDGVIYTVVVFAAVLTSLRPPWRRSEFWESLAAVFIGHTLILFWAVLVLQEFPTRRRFGMPKLLLIPLGSIEGVFIGGILWKSIKALRTSGPQSRVA